MKTLRSYLLGKWPGGVPGPGLVNPTTESELARIDAPAGSMRDALEFGRSVGGGALREMGFRQRGRLLKSMAGAIHANRDELLALATANGGNTRSDAKFDIDGASGTLAWYAELADELGDGHVLHDGESHPVGRSPRFCGQHVFTARHGVAIHINAFNFPAWGTMEKVATAILAGMPVLSKPASATALVAHRITEILCEQKLLPDGVFQLLLGPVGDLFEHATPQDVVAFTGSSQTGLKIRGDSRLLKKNVRVNVEADSLNAAVLGNDVELGSDTFDMFVAETVKDIAQKTGQKCTAIRRLFVPTERIDDVTNAMSERLADIKIGNPELSEVRMGPLATKQQFIDFNTGLDTLASDSEIVYSNKQTPIGVANNTGFFVAPTLLRHSDATKARYAHQLEVFGPVATILPYDGTGSHASELTNFGKGSLVASVYSDNRAFIKEMLHGCSAFHGRIYVGSQKVAGKTPGPGTVLPQLVHGGPGRAGAGEELGGLRGMSFYMQRTAWEGDRQLLEAST